MVDSSGTDSVSVPDVADHPSISSHLNTMPLFAGSSRVLDRLRQIQSSALPPASRSISFITPPASAPLQPLQPIDNGNVIPPQGSLVISLSHPDPSKSPATEFFLHCVPDPCTTAYYSALLIHRHLTASTDGRNDPRWRHHTILLKLEDKEGLAATSGGTIGISLKWVGDVMRDVQAGKRAMDSAAQEFKGVSESQPLTCGPFRLTIH